MLSLSPAVAVPHDDLRRPHPQTPAAQGRRSPIRHFTAVVVALSQGQTRQLADLLPVARQRWKRVSV